MIGKFNYFKQMIKFGKVRILDEDIMDSSYQLENGDLTIINLDGIEVNWDKAIIDRLSLECVDNLDVLNGSKNLTSITITSSSFESIELVTNNVGLKELTITSSKLTSINGIKYLTKLIELNLCNNQISDISQLSNLTKLRTLTLSTNNLADISPLSKLVKLEFLGIVGNPAISDYSVFEKIDPGAVHMKIEHRYLYTVNLYLAGKSFIEEAGARRNTFKFGNYIKRLSLFFPKEKYRNYIIIKLRLLWLNFFYLRKNKDEFNRFSYLSF